MKKAIAYVSDIILGRTGEVIKRSCQVELIAQYASDKDTEIIGWFEDEVYNEEVFGRPGIRALLSYDKPYDLLICERVWALSRSMAILEPFFKELDRRGVRLECATTMWDCVSQQCRRRFRGSARALSPKATPVPAPARKEADRASVARPTRLRFAHLIK
jgi:DNA invertase Pin-like site-specific DNA recombinase